MENKKKRSTAQKAADKRYNDKNRSKYRSLSFILKKEEATELEQAIAATGLSKVDFLRQAVKNYKPQ